LGGKGIKSIGQEEKQTRFYITSSDASAEVVGKAVRAHWGIENQLHGQLMSLFPKINHVNTMVMRLKISL